MSTTLTLGNLRVMIGTNIGEPAPLTGTFTNTPGVTLSAVDTIRFDDDHSWDGGWIQDTTTASITRVKSWAQATSTFTLFAGFPVAAAVADAYEVHAKVSFADLRTAINNGIAFCGKKLRVLVRDETNVLTANQYTVTPNYSSALPNAFFPGGVVQISYEYWTGQSTRRWITIPQGTSNGGWEWLDDSVLQLPQNIVDGFSGNPLRLTGYGPLFSPLTADTPSTVIATFTDDWMIQALAWACTYQAWLLIAGRQAQGESGASLKNAQAALQNFSSIIKEWKRPTAIKTTVVSPYAGSGWGD